VDALLNGADNPDKQKFLTSTAKYSSSRRPAGTSMRFPNRKAKTNVAQREFNPGSYQEVFESLSTKPEKEIFASIKSTNRL
jgi:hypothetical protein